MVWRSSGCTGDIDDVAVHQGGVAVRISLQLTGEAGEAVRHLEDLSSGGRARVGTDPYCLLETSAEADGVRHQLVPNPVQSSPTTGTAAAA